MWILSRQSRGQPNPELRLSVLLPFHAEVPLISRATHVVNVVSTISNRPVLAVQQLLEPVYGHRLGRTMMNNLKNTAPSLLAATTYVYSC